ncbi:NAD-dependent epimerase/dehydratase family protein [Minwuia sp.]|uniref:NAD-dependent epimerase/dehydratase family protein n=1 Tax=Minwuia sp. TaxID=2493630 RepID=UPI003A8EDEB8
MLDIDTSRPVMLSGATGYLGSWITKTLLDQGLTVHAAIRSPDDTSKTRHLTELADASDGTIRFFAADLLDEGSYAEAMAGCSVVFHAASPFTSEFDDAQKELVDPALNGTRNVLKQVNETPGVERVVLTSSCAAVYGDNIDLKKKDKGRFTEDDWNETSSLEHRAYSYSKTVAEREAWKIAGSQDRWKLVTINPSFIMGPGIKVDLSSESFSVMKQFGDGTFKAGAPRWGIGVVDVRDVAEAHLRAGFIPEASGRHIISGTNSSFIELGESLAEKYGDDYPLPKRALPKPLLWLVGPFVNKNMTRKAVSRNVGYPWKADNSKSVEKLGLSYRPMKTTTQEMFQQLIDAGVLKPA